MDELHDHFDSPLSHDPHELHRQHERGAVRRTVLLTATVLVLGFVTWSVAVSLKAAWIDREPGHPDELVTTINLAAPDGQIQFSSLLRAMSDQAGLGGLHIDDDISLDAADAETALDWLESRTQGVFTCSLEDDEFTIEVNRQEMRRRQKEIRSQIRDLATTLFPNQAAEVAWTFGTTVFGPADAEARLDTFIDGSAFESARGVVITIHGLDDTGNIWRDLTPHLVEAGYIVGQIDYPNDQPIIDSVQLVSDELKRLKALGVEEVSLVGHSMGGLVSRELLTCEKHYNGIGTGHDQFPDVKRLIMVGTPNYGSDLATFRFAMEVREQVVRGLSGDGMLFGSVFDGAGEAKFDLLPDSEFIAQLNARPHPQDVELTIIAGRASPVTEDKVDDLSDTIQKLVPSLEETVLPDLTNIVTGVMSGIGDGAVTLESTALEGVEDYTVVTANHLSLIRNVLPNSPRVPPSVPIILDRLAQDEDGDGGGSSDEQ